MSDHHTTNLEIARSVRPRAIAAVAEELGLAAAHVEPFGRWKAKIALEALEDRPPSGALVLVTAMTPTPAGEGKTTITVGLTQALRRLGRRAVAAVRQPSLGPVLGMKGGGAGGGRSQLLPMEDINLFLTGDMHAVGAAHNLLSALADNELHFHGRTHLDPRRVIWRRSVDMNDRALRRVMVGLGGDGVEREDGFDITAASEVMAILCLARDRADLKERLGRVLVGWSRENAPVRARDLGAAGAMATLLREALLPNLVQTLEGGPALVHGGPFANIAHGCSSLLATRLGLAYGEVVVTEAGFASELGAEKFFHIKCRTGGVWPRAVVLVATCRALKHHGGVAREALGAPDPAAVERGLPNLAAHVANLRAFGLRPVVAINRFASDVEEELAVVEAFCAREGLGCARADAFLGGGAGCEALGRAVAAALAAEPPTPRFLYELAAPPEEKLATLARVLYGAGAVAFTDRAVADLAQVRALGLAELPVCVAKTPASLSDDPAALGRPQGFTLTVREVRPSAGAGFLVALTGPVLTMPGLPREPAALAIDIDDHGVVSGVY